MNTKLLAGISLAAMAGSFWACGEGQINGKEFSDTIVESMYDTPEALESLKEQAKTDCWQNDPACAAMYGSYVDPNASNPVVSSAAVIMSSSSIFQPLPGVSSSSEEVINNHGRSSSSIVIIPSSSESGPASSETVPVTGLGSCKPTKTPINKGEGTTWSFNRNSSSGYEAAKYQKASYAWNFGTLGTEDGKYTSGEITYANPGQATASVTVVMPDGKSETVECSPLQVNGDPITGCECNPTVDIIDITQNAVATWSVSGCKTSSMPLTYEWDADIAGDGANGGYQFTAAGTKAPSVTVHNNDSTAVKVACGAVKATDGPEYVLSFDGSLNASKDSIPSGACISVSGKWSDSYNSPTAKVSCDLSCKGQCNIVVNFGNVKDSVDGTWNQTATVDLGKISVGDFTPSDLVCVKFTNYEVDWQGNKTDITDKSFAKCTIGQK